MCILHSFGRRQMRTYRSIHDREREAELQLRKEPYRNWQVTGLILPVDVLERRLTSTIPRINDPPHQRSPARSLGQCPKTTCVATT